MHTNENNEGFHKKAPLFERQGAGTMHFADIHFHEYGIYSNLYCCTSYSKAVQATRIVELDKKLQELKYFE